MVTRVVGSLVLLYLSATTTRDDKCRETPSRVKWLPSGVCPEDSLTVSFAYAAFLAVMSFRPNSRSIVSPVKFHVAVLLSILGVYAYRDIWPLSTYALQPADKAEGNILWVKIALLTVTAVIIPIFIPHPYVPVDPKIPSSIPNPEQTASWISVFTYTFMDPTIRLANKVPHLRHDQLPPLADYDEAKYLSSTASKYIDPFSGAKRRHLFFGLITYFRYDYIIIAISLVLVSASSFASPIGINRTLHYLEERHQGVEPSIKPWVWILLMLFGPLSKSIFDNYSYYVQTRVHVRVRALLTQLVFEHSLRIRMKAEAEELESSGSQSSPANAQSRTGSEHTTNTLSSSSAANTPISEVEDVETDHEHDDVQSSRAASTVADSSAGASPATPGDNGNPSDQKKKKAPEEIASTQPPKKPSGHAENLIGKMNNLVTSDLIRITDGCDFLTVGLLVPMQMTFSILFLYQIFGWSALVGLAVTAVLGPVVGYIGKHVQKVQKEKMQFTDSRVQSITEAVAILRMIKMFGWEGKMAKRLAITREVELGWIWKAKILQLANRIVTTFVPTISMFVTFAVYTIIMKEGLTASKIFSSTAVFMIFREQLARLSQQFIHIVQAKVSLDRANSFLRDTELLDGFTETNDPPYVPVSSTQSVLDTDLGFRNATFSWSNEETHGPVTLSYRNFRLRIKGELIFKQNCINLITGPTGSGKTSILMALLGEMHFIPDREDSWFNLPRQGGVAYAAQESWVQNATIRENILFGSTFDEERYNTVVYQCALEKDFELFEAGDKSEVGERGLTLSGGQKARVTLARAIYSSAKIILLDDILAALDVHTSAWIVEKCFQGDLIKNRTILLVTHNIALAGPIAHLVVTLGIEGSLKVYNNPGEIAAVREGVFLEEVEEQLDSAKEAKEDETATSKNISDGKLVVAEEIVEGRVTWASVKLFLSGLGGEHPLFFSLLWLVGLTTSQVISVLQPWYLGVWGSQYETHAPSEVRLSYYLLGFSALIGSRVVLTLVTEFVLGLRSVRASRVIHAKLIDSVLGSTLRWLDETPTARIISRCTEDIDTVDNWIMQSVQLVVDMSAGMLASLASISLFTPVFLLPGIVAAVIGTLLGNVYLKAQLSMSRERFLTSNARSPLLAHFSAATHGLVSIRAYGAQKVFSEESIRRIDYYSRAARTSSVVNKWINLRIDTLGAVFTSTLAFYLVYGGTLGASNTGFSLNMSSMFCIYVFYLIRFINALEVDSNRKVLERIQGYLNIEHEPKPTSTGRPPAAWPTSGDIRVERLSARYSKSGPKVLHDLSFHIYSGQRIGVVGRTGSGKSSLTLALLRCILTEGTVIFDGIDTSTINLDALRSNITIIPQVPELLSGTLRQNLDPFDQNDDVTLNDALHASGLFSLQEDLSEEARLTLDSKIAGGGNNLSVGQRQIIALARAMVRGSKLLILDEATSAIDYNTDSLIQSTLRSKLGADITVITVAHRLQTIMDADKIVEFDAPKVLLQNKTGALRALVEGSADKELLYDLMERTSYSVA
ncbi:hypothetical protein CVT25_014881 [Psilocybe cyanescens]|uniref:P-loop containing nucleoside triphosphate hydrolase protein n=1 Tax=Psilocybe cyanescens TaxID=93625 RepID=A0A409WEU2_PSICY|nr:hypothetical protein CVT25_014881 [Psilocybe cyanescens]